jgi:hypothetical protein
MAIKKLLDKITGKAQREEAARLQLEASAEKQRKKEEAAKKRREQAEAKKAEAEAKKNSSKAVATAAGEPWVEVLSIEVDPADPGNGAFELDWNDIFVARLIKSGYQGKNDQDIVDNWFRAVCRNVVLETFEQEQADPEKRAASNRRDLGNGRTEVS